MTSPNKVPQKALRSVRELLRSERILVSGVVFECHDPRTLDVCGQQVSQPHAGLLWIIRCPCSDRMSMEPMHCYDTEQEMSVWLVAKEMWFAPTRPLSHHPPQVYERHGVCQS